VRPFVEAVFHPTDFSEASQVAFAHALAIALYRKARLTLLHVAPDLAEDDWRGFPPVRATLERWGLLEEGKQPGGRLPEARGEGQEGGRRAA